MYFVQGPPGSSRERVKIKIDLVSIKMGNFHDSRMSHNQCHLFNYYRVRFVHNYYASHFSGMSHDYFHLFNYCRVRFVHMIFMSVYLEGPMITLIYSNTT